MLPAFAIGWIFCGTLAAWRHVARFADDRSYALDILIAVILVFGGPFGLFVHHVLFRRDD